MARIALALLVPLLLTATASAGQPPSPTEPAAPATLWEAPAWQVELVGDVAVALEADLRHVVAVDLTSGRRRWRREVQKKANGYHTLSVVAGRLLLWAGNALIELAPKTGRVLARGEILHNRRDCVLMVAGEQGAASCENGLWLFSLRPVKLGAYLRASEVHLYEDLGQPHTTHYIHSARMLLGRAGDLAVVAMQDDKAERHGMFSAPAVLAAVDPVSGEKRWATSELVKSGLTAGGVVAGGGVAWVLSESTRAAGAVDTQTGALIWKLAAQGEETPFNGDLLGDGSALVVLADDTVSCRDLATGAERWRAPADGAARVLVLGGHDDPLVYTSDKPMKVAVATAAGAVQISAVPPFAQAFRDGDGLAIAFAGRVRRLDPRGAVRGEVAGPEAGSRTFAAGAVGGIDGGKEVIYAADGSRVAGLPQGSYLAGGGGGVIVVMTRPTERDQPAMARLVRLTR